MIVAVLLVVLALAVGGCACVLWAERGGPRWARAVANVTLIASELLHSSRKRRRGGLTPKSHSDD
ncbi:MULTISPECIES: hypothetical protein [unclassified Streptomyces]|uniref:hypothetical protein n=1 Tax=unclassified Streptomyces TaxID=2593676 RepID=UPI00381BEFE5